MPLCCDEQNARNRSATNCSATNCSATNYPCDELSATNCPRQIVLRRIVRSPDNARIEKTRLMILANERGELLFYDERELI